MAHITDSDPTPLSLQDHCRMLRQVCRRTRPLAHTLLYCASDPIQHRLQAQRASHQERRRQRAGAQADPALREPVRAVPLPSRLLSSWCLCRSWRSGAAAPKAGQDLGEPASLLTRSAGAVPPTAAGQQSALARQQTRQACRCGRGGNGAACEASCCVWVQRLQPHPGTPPEVTATVAQLADARPHSYFA